MKRALGEFEQIVMLAVLRLGSGAYGVTIRREIRECIGRDAAPGALYNTLDRLEEKGLLSSRTGESTPQRRGRPKRYFSVTSSGLAAVRRTQRAYQRLISGLRVGVSNA